MVNNITRITTATTTAITPAKVFVGVTVSNPGTSMTVTCKDGASGTTLCAITAPVGGTYIYNTGLVTSTLEVVTAGTVGDVEILWR